MDDVRISGSTEPGEKDISAIFLAKPLKRKLPKWAKILTIIIIVTVAAVAIFVAVAAVMIIAIGKGITDGFGSALSELIGSIFGSIIKEGISQAAEGVGQEISEQMSNFIS